MSNIRSAEAVVMKIVSLFTNDWSGEWGIESVTPTTYGQELVLRDRNAEEEFIVGVSMRTTAPAIQATVGEGVEI